MSYGGSYHLGRVNVVHLLVEGMERGVSNAVFMSSLTSSVPCHVQTHSVHQLLVSACSYHVVSWASDAADATGLSSIPKSPHHITQI